MLGAAYHGLIHSDSVAANTSNLKVASGVYTGTAAALAITGLGFRPQFLIIKANGTGGSDNPVIAWSGMTSMAGATPAAAVISTSVAPATGIITSYDIDGFTLANNALVNTSAKVYNWMAIAGGMNDVAFGNYTGDSVDGRTVSGLPFQPKAVFIRRRNLNTVFVPFRSESMTGDATFLLGDINVANANVIQALNSDGFELGNSLNVNTTGAIYDYFCLTAPSTNGVFSSYQGSGGTLNISGFTFQPDVVFVKGNIAREAVFRATTHSATTESSYLRLSQANPTGALTAINSDGFTTAGNAISNSASTIYHYMALKST